MLRQTILKLVSQSKARREFKWQNGTDVGVIVLINSTPNRQWNKLGLGNPSKAGQRLSRDKTAGPARVDVLEPCECNNTRVGLHWETEGDSNVATIPPLDSAKKDSSSFARDTLYSTLLTA